MSNERKVMKEISRVARELEDICKAYVVGKGVRRFIFYKDIKMNHFEIIVEDLGKVMNKKEVECIEGECFINTSEGKLKIRQEKLRDYFDRKSMSLNRIAMNESGFIFDKNIDLKRFRKDVDNREATFFNPTEDTLEEFAYLEYEGFSIRNFGDVINYLGTLPKKELMKVLKLAIDLKSYNISNSLGRAEVFDMLAKIDVSNANIRAFFTDCVRDEDINLEEIKPYKVRNIFIALIYTLIEKKIYQDDELDSLFLEFGVDVDKELYADIRKIYSSVSFEDFEYMDFENIHSSYIKDLVYYYVCEYH